MGNFEGIPQQIFPTKKLIIKPHYNKLLLTIFSKAFGTVNHIILLQKLDHLGMRDVTNLGFKLYSSSRKHIMAPTRRPVIHTSVFQGSILGPLLFLIYLTDLHNSSFFLNFLHFADDTISYVSHSNLNNYSTLLITNLKESQ